MTASASEIGPGLERRALGFVPVLFQSIVFAGLEEPIGTRASVREDAGG